MKIISLTLNNFLHFRLRQIKLFCYRPTKKTQIVLGTNGSGKSSLLRELSPLPASASDFEKGQEGLKEIEIEHLGRHYLLQSIFGADGNRFPFIVDGENLNPGFTVTVYRELVKAHFGYTQDIHALLTGRTSFSRMSVAERRNWFTRISDIDYTYALTYHNRLKTRVRDLQGALKRNQERLTKEVERCLTTKEEALLRVTVTDLNQILDQLLSHRKPRLPGRQEKEEAASALDSGLQRDMARLETILADSQDLVSLSSPDALERAQVGLQADIQVRQTEVVRRCETIESLRKAIDAATAVSRVSVEEVEATLRHLYDDINTTRSHIRLPFHFDDPFTVLAALETSAPMLEDILTQLAELPVPLYTRDQYQWHLEQAPGLSQQVLKLKAREEEIFDQLKIYEANKAKHITECPKCNHQWFVGYDERHYLQLTQQRTVALSDLDLATTANEKNAEALTFHQTYFALMAQYVRLMQHFDILSPYWDYVSASGLMQTAPLDILRSVATLRTDLKYHLRIKTLTVQLDENTKLSALMRNTGKVDLEKLTAQITQETDTVTTLQSEIRKYQAELTAVKSTLVTIALMAKLREGIESAISKRTAVYTELIEDECVAVLDELIRSVKVAVSQHERTLSQVDIQKGIVQTLGVEIKTIDAELVLLKRAQKALSPTEGLIARGMTTFINHFLEHLNEFIAKVWSYPLVILPLLLKSGDDLDLDYRFPVRVNDDLEPPDVSLTSAGMQEIIDLAFVTVSMQHLGLTNSPVFLDEFAKTFDVAHRQAAYRAIDVLIDSTDYSQVFLVSHYQTGYSSLTASDVLVLCDSNVELPGHLVYNKHVTMH